MTKFNPSNAANNSNIDWEQMLNPAMEITDPDDAKQYLESFANYLKQKFDLPDVKTAVYYAKKNLGSWACFSGDKVMNRVYELFDCKDWTPKLEINKWLYGV